MYASISFAVLLLGIGLPLWWQTTAVPRVPLPYSGIAELSALETRIRVKVLIAGLVKTRIELLTEEIGKAFADSGICTFLSIDFRQLGVKFLLKTVLFFIPEPYHLDVSYEVISSKLVSSSYTPQDHEKVAKTFDIEVGDLLLLESPNVYGVLVGSGRSIFFAKDTSEEFLTYFFLIFNSKYNLLGLQNLILYYLLFKIQHEKIEKN